MSLKGVRQLKQLIIRYSDRDGSSRGIVSWMRKNLVQFAQENPEIEISTVMKRNVHPFIRGIYLNKNIKVIDLRNYEVKDIQSQVLHLRNQIGRRMNSTGYAKPCLSQNPTIQGEWHERMDVIDLPVQISDRY